MCMNWIQLAHDRDRWRAFVNTMMNLRVLQNSVNFLINWGDRLLHKKNCLSYCYWRLRQSFFESSCRQFTVAIRVSWARTCVCCLYTAPSLRCLRVYPQLLPITRKTCRSDEAHFNITGILIKQSVQLFKNSSLKLHVLSLFHSTYSWFPGGNVLRIQRMRHDSDR
jgi:hypothetical protein